MTDNFLPRGYPVSNGFFGFLPGGGKLLFPTEGEYFDYLADLTK